MTDYKATPEQQDAIARAWAHQQDWSQRGDEDSLCFLELRSRIERLELGAGIRDIVAEGVKDTYNQTSNSDQIRSLLVQRVSLAICYAQQRDETGSRAAISEVADWLREYGGWNQVTVAEVLEKELSE